MLRFLIVEDDPDTLSMLETYLGKVFGKTIMDTAGTVEDGLKLIRSALKIGFHYHVAILDFKLPDSLGTNPEIDENVCAAIRRKMPRTVVVHITAYPNDERIITHINRYHHIPHDPIGFMINKLDTDWPDQLKRKICSVIIHEKLDSIFGKYSGHAEAHPKNGGLAHAGKAYDSGVLAGSGPKFGLSGQTQILSALIHDIQQYWPFLDDKVKKRIKNVFVVREGVKIDISLF